MSNNAAKEKALKNAKVGEIVTDEVDRYRGYWVRSEEGDIIRANGERGYWSDEPPTPEFRAERRRKSGQNAKAELPGTINDTPNDTTL